MCTWDRMAIISGIRETGADGGTDMVALVSSHSDQVYERGPFHTP